MSTVRYDLEVDGQDETISALEKTAAAMQKTADEADDLSNSMELLSIPARKVTGAQKEAAASSKALYEAFDGVSTATGAMGGKIGAASGIIKGLADGALKAGGEMGPLGVSLAAVAAGAVALSFAVWTVVDSLLAVGRAGVDAREDIDGIVDDEVIDHLDELNRKFEALDLQAKVLTGTLSSELSPAIGFLIDELVGLARVGEDAVGWLNKFKPPDELLLVARAIQALASGGLTEVARKIADIGEQTEEQLAGSLAHVIGGWSKLKAPVEDHQKTLDEITKQYEEMERAAEKADREALAEITRRLGVGHQVTELMQKELDKQRAAEVKYGEFRFNNWKSTLDRQLTELDSFVNEAIAKNKEETAAFEKELDKRKDLHEKIFNAVLDQAGQMVTQTWGAMFDELSSRTTTALAGIEGEIQKSNERIAKWREADTEESKKLIAEELEKIKQLEEDKRALQLQAWKDEQQLKAGQAVMAGAMAIVQAFAQLGPIAGAVVTPAIVGMTAMQVETILGQSPPPMHDGGVLHNGGHVGADEFFAGNQMLRTGESAVVFNQRATETGAVERAMAKNRDMDDEPREMRLVFVGDNRAIGELVAREQRRPGSPIAAFGSPGFVDPYRRS